VHLRKQYVFENTKLQKSNKSVIRQKLVRNDEELYIIKDENLQK